MGFFIENNYRSVIIIAVLLLIISIQSAQLIEMESGTETYIDKGSSLYQDYDHLYRNNFATEPIVIMVEGTDSSHPELLNSLDRIEMSVSEFPGIVDVLSPSSIVKDVNYQTTGRKNIPSDRVLLNGIVDEYVPSPLMPDDRHAFVRILIDGQVSDSDQEELLEEIEKSIEIAGIPPGYHVTVTGFPAFLIGMQEEMLDSITTLLLLAIILMTVVLYIVFKHVRWRLLPLPIVIVGIIFTFGAMGLLDISMTMVSMAAFPVLIGIGIDYAIQFQNRLEEELEIGKTKQKAVVDTITYTGPAVLNALIITSLGFLALLTSNIPMIRDFGLLLIIGVIMCFIAAMFLGIAIFYGFHKIEEKRSNGSSKNLKSNSKPENESDILKSSLKKIALFSINHSGIILILAAILCIGGLYADTTIPIETDTESFVPQDMPVLIDLKNMRSIVDDDAYLNLIIKTDDNTNPELLEWIDGFSQHQVDSRSYIHSSSSIVDIIKETSYAAGTIPNTQNEIESIYDNLCESQLSEHVHENDMLLLKLNVGSIVRDKGIEGIDEVIDIVYEDIVWIPPPPGTSVTITGNSVVMTDLLEELTSGRLQMTFLGIIFVFLGLLVLYKDVLKALIPVTTMFIVIGWSGFVMYFTGVEYTPMTATMGALILAVGSEYAILIMERYFEEKNKGFNTEYAMIQTFGTVGKAIIASGITTIFGFSALIASSFGITSSFGLITVINVSLALFATFMILPALIVSFETLKEKRTIPMFIEKVNFFNGRL
ncbi:efflux RND transporter permease subunit [Methanosalsum natronophilum]|uniref:efflux RND transporter permease subunit n=1 Tax=Methanosalsum natronophilum TaxID=768733 RepID=UPI002169661D|nr:RND family transporter [Methanosalsum natronophilum]